MTTDLDRSLHAAKLRAVRFVSQAFPPGVPPRSLEYRKGMFAFFVFSLAGERITCPFAEGTAEFDAFFAGVDGARAIARRDMQ